MWLTKVIFVLFLSLVIEFEDGGLCLFPSTSIRFLTSPFFYFDFYTKLLQLLSFLYLFKLNFSVYNFSLVLLNYLKIVLTLFTFLPSVFNGHSPWSIPYTTTMVSVICTCFLYATWNVVFKLLNLLDLLVKELKPIWQKYKTTELTQ